MQPGRELDALIAEKIFKLPRTLWREGEIIGEGLRVLGCRPNPYSTDISAAWEVVEKLGMCIDNNFADGKYRIREESGQSIVVVSDSAPHAICLYALKTLGHDSN